MNFIGILTKKFCAFIYLFIVFPTQKKENAKAYLSFTI